MSKFKKGDVVRCNRTHGGSDQFTEGNYYLVGGRFFAGYRDTLGIAYDNRGNENGWDFAAFTLAHTKAGVVAEEGDKIICINVSEGLNQHPALGQICIARQAILCAGNSPIDDEWVSISKPVVNCFFHEDFLTIKEYKYSIAKLYER